MEWVKLCDVAEVIMGQSPKSEYCNDNKEGLPFYQGVSDFGEIYPVPTKYCTEPKKIAEIDDILIGVRAPVGDLNISNSKCCIGRGVAAIRANEKFISKNYLYYFLKTKRQYFDNNSTGSTFKAINKSVLYETLVPIIDINKQKIIENLLNRIENIIRKRKEQIHAYDDLIESLFFHILNNGNIKKNKLKDFIVTSQNGFSKRGKDSRGKIVLKIPNINYNYLNFENINRIKLDNKDFKKYLLNLGDLLLVRVNGNPNYVGRSTVFDYTLENCCFNDHIIRIKTKDINVRYLSYYINSIYGKNQLLQNIKTSAGQYTISRNGLDNIEILYPKREMQNYFERVFNRVEEEKKKLNSSLAKLEILFNALMQEAFSGKLFKD